MSSNPYLSSEYPASIAENYQEIRQRIQDADESQVVLGLYKDLNWSFLREQDLPFRDVSSVLLASAMKQADWHRFCASVHGTSPDRFLAYGTLSPLHPKAEHYACTFAGDVYELETFYNAQKSPRGFEFYESTIQLSGGHILIKASNNLPIQVGFYYGGQVLTYPENMSVEDFSPAYVITPSLLDFRQDIILGFMSYE
jgi:hypothetical protein